MGEALENKCKPKPIAKPEEHVMMAKSSCSFEADALWACGDGTNACTHKTQVVSRQW